MTICTSLILGSVVAAVSPITGVGSPVIEVGPGEVAFSVRIDGATPNGPLLSSGDQFGRSIVLMGDLDDDGVPDLAVGAPNAVDNGSATGVIWVLFMEADGGVRQSVKIGPSTPGFDLALNSNAKFGKSLASIGDINGDGFEDLAVGASGYDLQSPGKGALFFISLFPDASVSDVTMLFDPRPLAPNSGGSGDDNVFSRAIAILNETFTVSSTATVPMVVGYPVANNSAGMLEILDFDPLSGIEISLSRYSYPGLLTSGFPGPTFGDGLELIGDINGDGIRDLAVGAMKQYGGSSTLATGGMWIGFLDNSSAVTGWTSIVQGENGVELGLVDLNLFGRDFADVGDLDGNGVPDVIVGASEDTEFSSGDGSGSAYVLFLDASGGLLDYHRIAGDTFDQAINPGDEFGVAVESIGDWDGDGVSDVAIGARYAGPGGEGAIYLTHLTGQQDSGLSSDTIFEKY